MFYVIPRVVCYMKQRAMEQTKLQKPLGSESRLSSWAQPLDNKSPSACPGSAKALEYLCDLRQNPMVQFTYIHTREFFLKSRM